jgi:Fe2+ transport system protein FeoA
MNTACTLSDLRPGQTAIVEGFIGESTQQFRLMELGLLPGTAVRFIRQAPMGDPIEFEVRGTHLSLRRCEALAIAVVPAV